MDSDNRTFSERSKKSKLSKVRIGDLVWRAVSYHGECNYFPIVVGGKNVNEGYLIGVNPSTSKQGKYDSFLIGRELLQRPGFSESFIQDEYRRYSDIIESIKGRKK